MNSKTEPLGDILATPAMLNCIAPNGARLWPWPAMHVGDSITWPEYRRDYVKYVYVYARKSGKIIKARKVLIDNKPAMKVTRYV
jgi:hypothetical protein